MVNYIRNNWDLKKVHYLTSEITLSKVKIIDRMSLVKLQKTIGSGKFIKLLIENLTW